MPKKPTPKELRRIARERFSQSRRAAIQYERKLSAVGKQVSSVVKGFSPTGEVTESELTEIVAALNHYASMLGPWAKAVTLRMHADVGRRDAKSWFDLAREMGREIRHEIFHRPTGATMREAMNEQVSLITSLPLEAAQRVHKLTREALINSTRASEIAKEILKSGQVTASRARLIARTEVARTGSLLTEARAEAVGSTHYRWVAIMDQVTRPQHRKLNGKVFRWDSPPNAGTPQKPMHYNPGCGPNCFVGSTRFSLLNGLRHLWRVFYEGPIIDIVSTGGQLLTLTPNHPILTTRGWLPASQINQGDDLICFPEQMFGITENNQDQMLPTFEDLFVAFSKRASLIPASMFNFYGDVFDGYVDEITFEPFLPLNNESMFLQEIAECTLASTYSGMRLSHIGGTSHIGKSNPTRFGDQLSSLIGRQSGHSDDIGLTTIPGIDTVLQENASYGTACDLEMFSNGKFAHLSGDIHVQDRVRRQFFSIMRGATSSPNYNSASPEFLAKFVGIVSDGESRIFQKASRFYERLRVRDKVIRDFSGHVFTVETESGWYCASQAGIISKNCRCYAESLLNPVNTPKRNNLLFGNLLPYF